ncbi:MAG: hypothetical protein KAR40_13435 [Candidatus Sabulitectum sp.]|nr:hypothetical protein [Candidatus Sabulitectum sp.]
MGFSNRSYLLQIIPGSLLLALLLTLLNIDYQSVFAAVNGVNLVMPFQLLCTAFIIGALLDLVADVVESVLYKITFIRQPSRSLLYHGESFGIKLPHYETIKKSLSDIAQKHSDCPRETASYFSDETQEPECQYEYEEHREKNCRRKKNCKKKNKKNKKNAKANHLFQAARSIAFRRGEKSQIDQIEAYFSHYIFSRNTSLCVFIMLVIAIFRSGQMIEGLKSITSRSWGNESITVITIALAISFILFSLAYYRFKIYYSRSVLEAIHKIG